jgi:ribosomal protein S18 acetylase RimI-like enzyme
MTKQHLPKNSMDIQIKHLKVGDEAILGRVAIDVFDEAIDLNYLRIYLAEANHHLIVAIKEGEVVGQIRAVIHKHPDRADELYIDNLGVTPTLQRQGNATKLLNAMLGLGKSLGCEEAWLATESNKGQAKGFYESYSIKPEGMAFYLFKL